MTAVSKLGTRHFIVTGASKGIGAAIAERLAGSGAKLSLLARDAEKLDKLTQRLNSTYSAKVQFRAVDLTKSEAVEEAFREIVKSFGPAAVLVNNAGAAESASFAKSEAELWRRMLDVNLNSAFYCTRQVLDGMLQAGWGRIVNIASTAGLKGYPYMSAYCAAKHALVGLTRSLAVECVKAGVTVNAICPGFTDTDLLHNAAALVGKKSGRTQQEVESEYLKFVPQGKFVTPAEIASAVEWLCMEEQSSLTGQTLVIAGGEL